MEAVGSPGTRAGITFSMIWTTSIPFITRPNTVCLLSNHGVGTVVTKNCGGRRRQRVRSPRGQETARQEPAGRRGSDPLPAQPRKTRNRKGAEERPREQEEKRGRLRQQGGSKSAPATRLCLALRLPC